MRASKQLLHDQAMRCQAECCKRGSRFCPHRYCREDLNSDPFSSRQGISKHKLNVDASVHLTCYAKYGPTRCHGCFNFAPKDPALSAPQVFASGIGWKLMPQLTHSRPQRCCALTPVSQAVVVCQRAAEAKTFTTRVPLSIHFAPYCVLDMVYWQVQARAA